MPSGSLLEIKALKTYFHTEAGTVSAVDGVSLEVGAGEIVGIVGESGCGKSVTAQSILRLLDEKSLTSYEGEIRFDGVDLLQLSQREMRGVRGNDISMIFQDPLSSLNPLLTIGEQITETIRSHRKFSKKNAFNEAVRLLRLTGIPSPERRVFEYPHQLSGGMRQRVMIAIALACEPKLLIADEPTTALDVTIQAQIMDLLMKLNKELGMSVLLITHDLGVVAEVCDRVAVMYAGQIVETADVATLFRSPQHPYTVGLLKSIPSMDRDRTKPLQAVEGFVPALHQLPKGCRFAPRCQHADELCRSEMPVLETKADIRAKARCWHSEALTQKEAAIYA
ncbi:peptide ABC transporter ATP-binding protein [Paenibacillus sp. FSL H8-0548]|uniref:ABC transporter ATP-binding protein n=1 Tax=Paenibacillus sp. FSL H8-0548 TaxID=1920422 RepID=UPI00096EBA4E|nr:ABC transporter ATP-binding protein [Paenibacillus sp. FSL H8-0548]OMF38321.1 peptide ABC transporter ATP-binding protein [Paenibacillus sp. FSL H8-0548]